MGRWQSSWGTWTAAVIALWALPELALADRGSLMVRVLPSVAVPAACLMLFMATIQRRR